MADVIATLHKRNDPDTNIYPNVKDTNIPDTILRVADLGKYVNLLTSININGDADYVSVTSDIGTFTTADITTLNVSGTADIEGKATFGSDVEVDGTITLNSPESVTFKTGSLDFSELTSFIATYNKEAYQFRFAGLTIHGWEEGYSYGFYPYFSLDNFSNATDISFAFLNANIGSDVTQIGLRFNGQSVNCYECFERATFGSATTRVLFSNATLNLTLAFQNSSVGIVAPSEDNPVYVTNLSSAFQYCSSLTEVGAFDLSKCTSFSSAFQGCSSLKSILCTHFKRSFAISASTKFEESDLVTIISNLDTVTTAQTLTMGSTNLAKLTQDEILVATGRGWTLA